MPQSDFSVFYANQTVRQPQKPNIASEYWMPDALTLPLFPLSERFNGMHENWQEKNEWIFDWYVVNVHYTYDWLLTIEYHNFISYLCERLPISINKLIKIALHEFRPRKLSNEIDKSNFE